ncbi:MAG: hypothetical protein M1497_11680 [Nitrospirae bacterium]|nr:hypothetical protein [Nitrospirota bacterium]
MPEFVIRDLIISSLKDTDYNPDNLSTSKSVANLFKNYITALDENILIVDTNAFEVVLDINDYNQIIYTETYYGLMRIARQGNAILALLKDENAPKAWLLVTVYYHAFFCAHLISRLLGRYSCYFSNEEMTGIKSFADNPGKRELSYGNYVGYYSSYGAEGIKIKFRSEGDRPHHTAWKNLNDKFSVASMRNMYDGKRFSRIQLFKKIIDDSVRKWPLPSEIRNRWNYADIILYSKKGDETASEFVSMLVNSKDLNWASRKVNPDPKNIATSVAFISSTLNRSLEASKSRILR